MDKYILVGKTRKTHGVKGGVKLAIEEKFIEDVLQVEVAFLKMQGKFLPYFIEKFEYTNNLIVRFEDINSPEEAHPVTSKEFYIRSSDIKQQETITYREGNLAFGKLIGYTIHDKVVGVVGKIVDIHEFPQQEMAEVDVQGKEVFIPLNEQLILSSDDHQQIVQMQLPEGLLDL